MRWFNYDGLALGVIAAIAVVFGLVDYVWYKRQLARRAKLASDAGEGPYVRPSALDPRVDSEPLRSEQPDDPR